MRVLTKYKLLVAFTFGLSCLLLYKYKSCCTLPEGDQKFNKREITNQTELPPSYQHNIRERDKTDRIVMSFVVCDARLSESLNMVKSVLLFTSSPVHFIIFTDDKLGPELNETLARWKRLRTNLNFELKKIKFPESHEKDWLNLFSKCAAQRLFMPELLPHIDSLIYVDTDTLFLGPVDELWEQFYQFNATQISALALEDDNPNVSWYPRFAKHPFYGKFGLNSGVMLMNLTRLRGFGWMEYLAPVMLRYKYDIPWGDQDIINIIFHYHPRAVYLLSCRYNYRSDQCMYGDACADASSRGVYLLHGSRGAFHNRKQPAFGAVYRAIEEYELETDPRNTVLRNMRDYFLVPLPSTCGMLKEAFLKVPNATIHNMYSKPDR